jgi:Leucine-rich repeat (LRR) protein
VQLSPDFCANLTSLKALHLPNNNLTSLPETLGSLVHLTQLNLLRNQLVSLPTVSQYVRMHRPVCMYVYLWGLRKGASGSLVHLTQLNLLRNQLVSLPAVSRYVGGDRREWFGDAQLGVTPRVIWHVKIAAMTRDLESAGPESFLPAPRERKSQATEDRHHSRSLCQ